MTLSQNDIRTLVSKIARMAQTDPKAAETEAEKLVTKVFFEAGLVFEELETNNLIRGSGTGIARDWANAIKAEVTANWRR